MEFLRQVSGDWATWAWKTGGPMTTPLPNVGFSAYQLDTGVKIWIIAEAERSSTCILLPEEY